MPELANNKAATFHYELLDRIEAGILLTGPEVKSAKAGQIGLRGSYVSLETDGAWLINAYIAPYKPARLRQKQYDPHRPRRLLINKREVGSMIGKMAARGLTIVPISFYTKGGLIKVELAVARGKSRADKRATIKKREADRRIAQALRRRR